MSNTTKLALEASLKKLLLKKPVDKITINDLTEDCGISRMAFYYHFKDIYDLVEWVCLEDARVALEDGKRALADKKTYSTWSEGLEQIFEAVLENKPFILNVYHSVSQKKIESYLYKLTYDLLADVVEEECRDAAVRGFDDLFLAPHSRHTEVSAEDIHNCKALTVLAESREAGVFLCMAMGGRQIFVMGHPEYDRVTLDGEYKRDKGKGLEIEIPANYYPENDPELRPRLLWRAHANNLYTNWLNYYVYQCTPYDLEGTPF